MTRKTFGWIVDFSTAYTYKTNISCSEKIVTWIVKLILYLIGGIYAVLFILIVSTTIYILFILFIAVSIEVNFVS